MWSYFMKHYSKDICLPRRLGQKRPVQEEETNWDRCNDDDDAPVSLPVGQTSGQNRSEDEVDLNDVAAVHALLRSDHFHDQDERDEKNA